MKVKDVMTKNVVTIGADASVADAAKKMKDADVGSIVVLDHNAVKGIVTDRKIVTNCIAENKDPGRERIGNITSSRLITCSEDSDMRDALMTLDKNKIRRCPVVNDKKELVGMLSIVDIAREMKGCMDYLLDDISRSAAKAEHHETSRPVIR
ncbi:MAG TPA: CBS domain-containing protein [Methanocella sp.]|uniref:CBS domain-containing protein n=1 Tax=Methanocella sp. TaxID=2052833 RepID=UPI002C526792|nr:CBS domain-containing protein [Methanocella sp.]HTY90826.1 CBS domain-containing protein [Methanocella sp.]